MRLTAIASFLVCLCTLWMFAWPSPAGAFGLTGFGGKLGYMSPENLDGTLAVGAHLEFERHGSRLHLLPSLMYWKANSVSDLSANADLYYHLASEGLMTPYLGVGLGINRFHNENSERPDTKLGANLFGGIRLPAPGHHYFLEGRYTASEISQFSVLGGITFHGSLGR